MGAGINLFRQLFPEDYYAYQTATLISSKPTSKVIKDSNDQTIATYPFGGAELRGLFKKDADGNIYAYGDRYNSDGSIDRVFGVVDLGSLSWNYITSGSVPRFQANLSPVAKGLADNTKIANAIADIFAVNSWSNVTNVATYDDTLAINLNGDIITIHDSTYTDKDTFTNAMSGHYLVYELATPTTETSTAFDNPQAVGATEEFTDSRSIKMPCGHDTVYSKKLDYRYW